MGRRLVAAGRLGRVRCDSGDEGQYAVSLTVIWALIAMAVNQFSRATPASSTTVGAVAVGMVLLVGTTLLVSRGRRARSVLRSGEQVTF
jgi:hypothetical protein